MKQPAGPCPICNKPFAPADDIVTCPDCGAPYHRACYQRQGHCTFQDKHGTGFEYQAPGAGNAPDGVEPPPAGSIPCRNCGTANDVRNIFCENCGTPLHTAPPKPPYGQPGQQQAPGGFAAFAPVVDMTGEIDGIPKQDWAHFIGNSAPVYLLRMVQQDQRSTKLGFMFSAFFLGPFYFAYRKMWGWAALASVLYLIVSIPTFIAIMHLNSNPLVAGLSTAFVDNLTMTAGLVRLVIQVLTGLFSLYLYRRFAAKKIKSLREQFPSAAEYQAKLGSKGNTSPIGIIVIFAALFAIVLVSAPFIGDDMMNYMQMYANESGAMVGLVSRLSAFFSRLP